MFLRIQKDEIEEFRKIKENKYISLLIYLDHYFVFLGQDPCSWQKIFSKEYANGLLTYESATIGSEGEYHSLFVLGRKDGRSLE